MVALQINAVNMLLLGVRLLPERVDAVLAVLNERDNKVLRLCLSPVSFSTKHAFLVFDRRNIQ